MTSHKHVNNGSPSIEIRTEKVRTVTTRQRSRANIFQGHSGESMRINVSSEDSKLEDDNFRTASNATYITNHLGRTQTGHQYSSVSLPSSKSELPTIG